MSELTTLHTAITEAVQAAMPLLATVGAYAEATEGTALPALFHSITDMRSGTDPGDGRSAVIATVRARITVATSTPQARLHAGMLAAQLIDLLRQQRWGLDFVEGACNVHASTDASTGGVAGDVTWNVQWEQVVLLGHTQWPWPDQPPGTLAFAFSPDTGPAHKDAYQAPEDLS